MFSTQKSREHPEKQIRSTPNLLRRRAIQIRIRTTRSRFESNDRHLPPGYYAIDVATGVAETLVLGFQVVKVEDDPPSRVIRDERTFLSFKKKNLRQQKKLRK